MKAALAALNLAIFAAANTVVDAADFAGGRKEITRRLRGINNSMVLGLARNGGKVLCFVRISEWNAKLVAASLAVDVYKTDAPRDAAGFQTFAVCLNRPVGTEIVEGLNDERCEKMGANEMSDQAWSAMTFRPEHFKA